MLLEYPPSALIGEITSREPRGVRREMDLLAEVSAREKNLRVLLHVEVEAKASAAMAKRLWKYYMQLRLRHDLLVLSILINLKGGKAGIQQEVLAEGFEPETARFRYRAFSLSGCLAEDYLSLAQPLAWALAALMRRGRWSRAEHKMECLRRIATNRLEPDRSWLLVNWVGTYLQFKGRDAAAFERLLDLPANREVKAMQMTWAEQMEAKYEAKYTRKGSLEALRRVVLRLLDRRFGQVPETVRRRVEAIDSTEPLNELAEKVLEARSIEEMGLS